MCWLILYYKKDYKDPEPKKIIARTFIVGAGMSTPFLFLYYAMSWTGMNQLFLGGAVSMILFPVLEEMAKISAAIFVVNDNKHEFNQIIDGVVYAVTAALGFSFMENLFYLSSFNSTNTNIKDFIYIVAFRSLGTMFAHTLFSGLAGLIWAYAYFSKKISPFNKKNLLVFEIKDWFNHEILSLHIIRHNILKSQPSRRGGHEKKVLVMEGLILAIFLHIIFNVTTDFSVFGKNLTFMLVPMLISGFFYISYLFTKRMNTKILKVV
jgi:RsiW-degrading membrane proteinase PrsW (M82 family)